MLPTKDGIDVFAERYNIAVWEFDQSNDRNKATTNIATSVTK